MDYDRFKEPIKNTEVISLEEEDDDQPIQYKKEDADTIIAMWLSFNQPEDSIKPFYKEDEKTWYIQCRICPKILKYRKQQGMKQHINSDTHQINKEKWVVDKNQQDTYDKWIQEDDDIKTIIDIIRNRDKRVREKEEELNKRLKKIQDLGDVIKKYI